jgi:hypothetical protein
VGQHALDGKVSFSGVGRPEDRHHSTMERTLSNHAWKIATVRGVDKPYRSESALMGRTTQDVVAANRRPPRPAFELPHGRHVDVMERPQTLRAAIGW